MTHGERVVYRQAWAIFGHRRCFITGRVFGRIFFSNYYFRTRKTLNTLHNHPVQTTLVSGRQAQSQTLIVWLKCWPEWKILQQNNFRRRELQNAFDNRYSLFLDFTFSVKCTRNFPFKILHKKNSVNWNHYNELLRGVWMPSVTKYVDMSSFRRALFECSAIFDEENIS